MKSIWCALILCVGLAGVMSAAGADQHEPGEACAPYYQCLGNCDKVFPEHDQYRQWMSCYEICTLNNADVCDDARRVIEKSRH